MRVFTDIMERVDFKMFTHSFLHLTVCVCSTGHVVVRYNNLGSAVYAKEKLNGFEYPPGNRLSVTYIDDGEDRTR